MTLTESSGVDRATTGVRLRTGVIGSGLIAQAMHLHHLGELPDLFDVAAICDLSNSTATAAADRHAISRVVTDWHELLDADLDAVLVLTGGDHATIAIGAARAGLHVFVEKPLCFSVEEGLAMVEAARSTGTTMMVGYNKRYDPAYERFVDAARAVDDARFLRVTTLESPIAPYVQHYPLVRSVAASDDVLQRVRDEQETAIDAALGDADASLRAIYQGVLLDTLVHELNAVRGILGEPTRLDYADLRMDHVSVMLRFSDLPVAIHWIDLPGIARYRMEFALYAPDRRITLAFPSPFLRNEPAVLHLEGGTPGTPSAFESHEVISYDSSFKRELIAFHRNVVERTPPITSAEDAVRDIALCQAIVACHRTGRPIDQPTRLD